MSGEDLRRRRTNVRASVRAAPGPCADWNDEEADFICDVLDLVGDKWSVLISTLADGPIRYSDLGRAIPGVSQRMLTLTLKYLQRAGLVIRTSYPEVPVSPPSTVSCLRSDSRWATGSTAHGSDHLPHSGPNSCERSWKS